MFDFKIGHELPETFVSKLGSVISYYHLGDPEMDHDIFLKKLHSISCIDNGHWFNFDPLCEVIHNYYQVFDLTG